MTRTATVAPRVAEPLFPAHLPARLGRVADSPAITALLVFAAYLAGARIGFLLVLPHTTPSVLWPPNAILTIALLLTPVRRWWICLLAALPAHILIQLEAGWPTLLVLGLFATNCSEALIAAGGVRAFSDAPVRFDTLRRVAIFVGAAALSAPFISSFLDAAVVTSTLGEPYWHVWRTRFFSNVLTELTLVPAVVSAMVYGPIWLRAARARQVEAALLAVGLLAAGSVAFAGPTSGPWAIPGSPRTPTMFVLPFLLWAAVRFGAGGTSLSLLATVVIMIVAGVNGRGPFFDLPPAESVLAIQVFLIAIGVPFLTLAAVVSERRRTKDALGERLLFEARLSRLSAAFVHLPSDAVEGAIETWLRSIADFVAIDVLVAFDVSFDRELVARRSWTCSGDGAAPVMTGDAVADVVERLRDEPSVISREGRSFLVLPLMTGTRAYGALAFVSPAGREWTDEQIRRLRLIAEVFATALARKEAEDALRASEVMKSAILNSLTDGVAVLNREGRIIAVNESWSRFARANGVAPELVGVGARYLDLSRAGAGPRQGIDAVLDGSLPRFSAEYACCAESESWWHVSAEPLSLPEGGAVVSHSDITERKRAEIEAQRSRQELAHVGRTSTIGELTSSLAHELNQPLAGIMANAQAAQRMLEATLPGHNDLRDALHDIEEDTRRGSEVIQRVRELVRKSEPHVLPLDLNALIREVTRLLASDAVIRNVTVELALRPGPLTVNGDHVQLRQVILNLLINAFDAVRESVEGERMVIVRTALAADEDAVQVCVHDNGPGLLEGTEEQVFDPFFSSKPGGMGMGLSISRSIVEAHGGVIRAENNRGLGATFQFTLALAQTP